MLIKWIEQRDVLIEGEEWVRNELGRARSQSHIQTLLLPMKMKETIHSKDNFLTKNKNGDEREKKIKTTKKNK